MTELEYDRWLDEQIQCLKTKNYEALDLKNLIEELEALGRAEKSAVKSLAFQILVYLLLIDYWEEESKYNKNHWQAEVNTFRFQLNDKLTTNLKLLLEDNLDKIYEKARVTAIYKSSLAGDRFPNTCPYSLEMLLGYR